VEIVAGDGQGVDVFLGVLDTGGVLVGVEDTVHCESVVVVVLLIRSMMVW
jgi:hypothetical protein